MVLVASLMDQAVEDKTREAENLLNVEMKRGRKTISIHYGSADWEYYHWEIAIKNHPDKSAVEGLRKELLCATESQLGVDHRLMPHARWLCAWSCYNAGDYDSAELWVYQCINNTRYASDQAGLARNLSLLGNIRCFQGRHNEAIEAYRNAYDIRKRMDMYERKIGLLDLRSAGYSAELQSDYETAEEIWREGIEWVQSGEVETELSVYYHMRLADILIRHKAQEAQIILQDALTYFALAPSAVSHPLSSDKQHTEDKLPALDPRMRQGWYFVYEVHMKLAAATIPSGAIGEVEDHFRRAILAFNKLQPKERDAVERYVYGIEQFARRALQLGKNTENDRLLELIKIGRDASVEHYGQDRELTEILAQFLAQLRRRQETQDMTKTPVIESTLVFKDQTSLSKDDEEQNPRNDLLTQDGNSKRLSAPNNRRRSRLSPSRLMARLRLS